MTTNCILHHREPKLPLPGSYLCRGHATWLVESLLDVVEIAALLVEFTEPGTAVDDGRQVRGKRVDPPAPVRLDVIALSDRRTIWQSEGDIVPVLAVLESWARMVREERDLQADGVATITGEAMLLHAHRDWIGAQPWVDELVRELRDVRSALHNAIGDHAPRSVGACPVVDPDHGECGGRLYQDRYGRLSVTCRKCGETWGETELRRLGLVIGA